MKITRKKNLLIAAGAFFALFYYNITYAKTAQVKAGFKESSSKIGKIVTLYLDFKVPDGFRLHETPEIKGLEDFEVIEKRITPKGIEIDLLTDRPKTLKLPSLTVVCYDQKGNSKELLSNPVKLKVESTITKKANKSLLRPIKGIIPVKSRIKTATIIILSTAALAMIVFLIRYQYKRRKKKEYIASYQVIMPHEKALNDLELLVKDRLPESGGIKSFYFRLSEILREYLEKIRDFNALEMTTDEIARAVKDNEDKKLVDILKKIDLVKFADFPVTNSVIEEHIVFSREYINNTKPNMTAS